jgi:hypothetical protein
MKVSGNTSNLISSVAACSMSCTVFLIVAVLSIYTGAAWAAATLNLVSFGDVIFFRIESCANSRTAWLHRRVESEFFVRAFGGEG